MLHSLTWETEIFFCGFGSRDLLFSVLALIVELEDRVPMHPYDVFF